MKGPWLGIGLLCALAAAAPAWAGDKKAAAQEEKAALKPDAAGLFAGYRGVSLPLPGHQLVFLKKGDHADVMVTFEAVMEGKRKEKVTATILQNVIVLDLLKPEALDGRGVAELLLNPNEAQYAALSMLQGDVRVTARAEGDTKMTPMEMASLRKLFK